jgi:two-component system sensor histidine kinase PhoQ
MEGSRSLLWRLLTASALLLPLTLGATGWYLERAHGEALNAAATERLQLQVLALLAQAEVGEEFTMPAAVLEPRLARINSGLYAMVTDQKGETLWLSASAQMLPDAAQSLTAGLPAPTAGSSHDSEYAGLFRHAFDVIWEVSPEQSRQLRFIVAESTIPREADIQLFRQQLILWFGVTVLALLAVQFFIVRWGLSPMRRLSAQIAQIEQGAQADLEGVWPEEVRPVVSNLRRLLVGERQRRERLRNTLGDLAHSLKTPLSVMRSSEPDDTDYPKLRDEQLSRMEDVINWQLQRAQGASGAPLQRLTIAPALYRLRDAMLKVYADSDLAIEVHCPESAMFTGDERDLMEMLGNLLDNACKHGNDRIRVKVSGGDDHTPLSIEVEDNGGGISPALRDYLLQRGARSDQRREGQGIGLAVVREIAESLRAKLVIGDSPLGGASVLLLFP